MKQILIIEDDQEIRTTIAEFLRSNGYDVTEAEDGERGLRAFESRPIDLVLTDIVMPQIEGLATIMDLKKKNPALKIIAMSGVSRARDYLDYARKLGASSVLTKPFEFQSMLSSIQELLASTCPES